MVSEAMLPRAAVREVEQRLTAAGCPDADFDARELFRLATGRDVRLSDCPLTAEQAAALEVLCTRRAAREPLQYLCGSWSFLDFELAVGPGVLCPRADTEGVAQAAAETLAGIESPRVLDLCAGTGCLGLGVKRFCPAAQVTCVEKSPAAFTYLEKNARCALTGQGRQTENVLEPSALEQADAPALDWGPALNALRAGKKPVYAVQPVQGDLFTYWETLPEGQLELIVSNPPYLTAAEMGTALHAFLERADFARLAEAKAAGTLDEAIPAERDRQVALQLTAPEIAEKLDAVCIHRFVESEAFAKICAAQQVLPAGAGGTLSWQSVNDYGAITPARSVNL